MDTVYAARWVAWRREQEETGPSSGFGQELSTPILVEQP
jgi:hypothetical protein